MVNALESVFEGAIDQLKHFFYFLANKSLILNPTTLYMMLTKVTQGNM